MTYLCPLCRTGYDELLGQCPDDGTPLIENRTGQSLGGRYTIRELLGLGGNGVTVWSAWQEDAERKVAVKLLPLDEAGRDHFLDASGKASVLDHPNVVRLFDFNKTEDGLACGVMELVEGRPLSVDLSEGQAMPVDEALHIVQQILAGLEHAHENGVLHLDVKPSNVFVTPTQGDGPHVKLVDFGLVNPRPVALRFAGPVATNDGPTEALHYTAPELLASGRAGPQSDLYSVGALLFRLMSGHPPFPLATAAEVARGHLTHLPPSPFSIRPIGEMPSALPEILEQALDKAPARRFASATSMREAIDAAMRGETLIDVRDEATVARVRVDDLSALLAPGPESIASSAERPSPPPESTAPSDDADSSRLPLLIAAIVAGLALLVWYQFGRQPATAPPAPPAVADAAIPSAPAPNPAPVPDAAPVADAAPAVDAAPNVVDAAPADAEPIAQIAVTITSSPSGGGVSLDGMRIGETPLTTEIAPGSYTVRVSRKGHTSRSMKIEVPVGSDPITRHLILPKVKRAPPPPSNPSPEPDAAPPPPPPVVDAGAPPVDAAPPREPDARPRTIRLLGEGGGAPAPTPAPAAPSGQPSGMKPLGQ